MRPISRTAPLLLALVAGCSTLLPTEPPRLHLDPAASPVVFRTLGKNAILVDPGIGRGDLARLGNFIAWSAREVPAVRLEVWDDEEAWQAARDDDAVGDPVLAHHRGEFVKDSGPPPVEQFTVFGTDGAVLYERDFLDYPLIRDEHGRRVFEAKNVKV